MVCFSMPASFSQAVADGFDAGRMARHAVCDASIHFKAATVGEVMSHGALRLEPKFKLSSDASIIAGCEYDGFDQSVPRNPAGWQRANFLRSVASSPLSLSPSGKVKTLAPVSGPSTFAVSATSTEAVAEMAGGAQRQVRHFSSEKVDAISRSSSKPGALARDTVQVGGVSINANGAARQTRWADHCDHAVTRGQHPQTCPLLATASCCGHWGRGATRQ